MDRMITIRGPKNYLPFLPFMASVLQFCLLAASYVVGALINESLDFLPFISELGKTQPERGLMTLAFIVNGSLTVAIMFLRAIQINSLYFREKRKFNKISFIFGILMVLGQATMVSFSHYEIDWLNWTGIGVYFIGASFYMITQTHISRSVSQDARSSQGIITLRVLCSTISVTCQIGFVIVKLLLSVDKQYKIPQATQWLCVLIIVIFVGSFSWDFNKIKFRSYVLNKSIPQESKRTNYADYLRNQARSRKELNGFFTYHSNSKL